MSGTDPQPGIWNIADQHFPGAIQIVDLYHARQHLWELARKLYPNQEAEQRRWMMIHQNMLDEGKIESLVHSLRSIDSSSPELTERIRKEAAYFENNSKPMHYPEFCRQHLFVGSGVIEAGCKTVIGSRCKQSGMFWTVRGANAILAWRCCQFNGRFEDYWENRRATGLYRECAGEQLLSCAGTSLRRRTPDTTHMTCHQRSKREGHRTGLYGIPHWPRLT